MKISVSNWSRDEDIFEKKRNELLEKVSIVDYVDHPFVFCRRQSLSSALSRIELFKKTINVKGSVVECGVHRGNGAMLFYHLSSIMEPYAFNRKIIGFDTFSGFKSLSAIDGKLKTHDFSDTSLKLLQEMASISDLNRPLSHIQKLELVPGNAVKTIPRYCLNHPELIISLLILDFDIYKPTKTALRYLLPLVTRGGIVAFDELNSSKFAGETKAFKEEVGLKKMKLEKFDYDPWMSYFVVE